MNTYTVYYYLGKKIGHTHHIKILADNEDDAKYQAELRIPYIHGWPIKFTITKIEQMNMINVT